MMLAIEEKLSLEQKIGQMVMAQAFGRFRSIQAEEYKALQLLVEKYYISGFKIYHGHSLGTLLLTTHLNKVSKIPLIFASDLEMGLGQQISDAPRFPPPAGLGAAGDTSLAYMMGYRTALEAGRLGINHILAPLLDLHKDGETYFGARSFGGSPDTVASMGAQVTQGIVDAGGLSTAKYFPGNGKQIFLPDGSTRISRTYTQLRNQEWIPFIKEIDQSVDSIMVSFGAFPNLDSTPWDSDAGTLPAALSKSIVTRLLRDEMGFRGLIITDALNLPFLKKHSIRTVAKYAVAAGVDILVALTKPQDAVEAMLGIYDALDQGLLEEAQIDYSVNRILRAKNRFIFHQAERSNITLIDHALGEDDTIRAIEMIARRSVCLLKAPKHGFPLRDIKAKLTSLVIGSSRIREQVKADSWQPWHRDENFYSSQLDWLAIEPGQPIYFELDKSNKGAPVIIVLMEWTPTALETFNHCYNHVISQRGKPILILPIAPNYAKQIAEKGWASLWVPDFYPASRLATFAVIAGQFSATGKLM